ncbi:MAG: dCMP deaminase family protein [Rhodospirillaceae bacterium]|jgi:dCMP deaminase|nr:dCMP deaminase family protein [Rhodospirillaceae bacterium]MBT5374756.1 dCMP deaminase family protein [Rhodospirillaceae bacterium]MBT5659787.1 dCMP deaminase family protein [Rhodospirillaceae bacterium]MBT5752170.1 dCMP deaminase family protein [Rhodospirillaceae bacterium]
MSKWDVRFLRLAHEVAKWSKDRSTRVGAVIVGEDRTPGPYGYNGFPRYVNDEREERHTRPEKYSWTEHAERNAIYNAARVGMALKGCTIYVTHIPCVDCTRAIIQVGMRQIIVDESCLADGGFKERWGEHEKTTKEMLAESGVELSFVTVPAGNEDD